jgi:ATP-dependent protease ClpP protease subunit
MVVRTLSHSGGPPIEPSESRDSVTTAPVRTAAADLFTDDDSSKKRKAKLASGGGLMATAGVALMGWNHWAELAAMMTLDTAGASLAVTGAAIACGSQYTPKKPGASSGGKAGGKTARKFKFRVLNDQTLLGEDLKELQGMSDRSLSLGDASQALLKTAQRKDQDEREAAAQTRREALTAQIEQDLESGLPPHRIGQKLQPRVFVVDFDDRPKRGEPPAGTAANVARLAEAISLLVAVASPYDEVCVKISSPGGAVSDYGLAASHMLRLKKANIQTTVCVDTVAASGGYMMACCSDRIVASPFSFLGRCGALARKKRPASRRRTPSPSGGGQERHLAVRCPCVLTARPGMLSAALSLRPPCCALTELSLHSHCALTALSLRPRCSLTALPQHPDCALQTVLPNESSLLSRCASDCTPTAPPLPRSAASAWWRGSPMWLVCSRKTRSTTCFSPRASSSAR